MSENNKSARKNYIKKKLSSLTTENLSYPKLSGTKKIRPVRKISKVSRERSSRNQLFLRQQQQHTLRTRVKPLTTKQNKEVQESLKAIKHFERAPFILVYAFGLASLILSLYSQLTSMLTTSIDLMTNLLKTIPFLGVILWISNTGIQAIGFGLSILVGFLQLSISMYISYFIWRYSTFMQRFLVRRLTWIIIPLLSLIPLVNLIPWSALSVFALQRLLKKRSLRGHSTLKKYNIKF